MKKEYLEPEIKCVKLAMEETILAGSTGGSTGSSNPDSEFIGTGDEPITVTD